MVISVASFFFPQLNYSMVPTVQIFSHARMSGFASPGDRTPLCDTKRMDPLADKARTVDTSKQKTNNKSFDKAKATSSVESRRVPDLGGSR